MLVRKILKRLVCAMKISISSSAKLTASTNACRHCYILNAQLHLGAGTEGWYLQTRNIKEYGYIIRNLTTAKKDLKIALRIRFDVVNQRYTGH